MKHRLKFFIVPILILFFSQPPREPVPAPRRYWKTGIEKRGTMGTLGTVGTDEMAAPGIIYNNPLNIRSGGDVFFGETIPSRYRGFKQFSTMAHGYRAAFVTLSTYNRLGFDTVEKIVMRWAPPGDGNDSLLYINHVAAWSGLVKTQPLTLYSGDEYIRLVRAMSRQEVGVCVEIEMMKGFAMQNRIMR